MDAALVDRARAGDQLAFDALYRRHASAVNTIVRESIRDVEERAEVVQDVFARAFHKLATIEDSTRFRPWIFAIARYAVIDHCRAARRSPTEPLDIEGGDELVSREPSAEDLAEHADALRIVADCMGALSRRDRVALVLVSHLGLGPAEVGEVLEISPGAAKVVVSRARTRLREAVGARVLAGNARCDELRVIRAQGDRGVASHIRTCSQCTATIRAEVSGYGMAAASDSGLAT